MSNLVVPGFDGQHTAGDVLNKRRSLQKHYLIDLEDACVAERDNNVAPQVPASPRLRPDISRPIHLTPRPGRAINMGSFKCDARTGSVSTSPAACSSMPRRRPMGLGAHDIELPPGNHRVTLSIAHTTGKTPSPTFNLSVAR